MNRKLTPAEVFDLHQLAGMPQPLVLVSTELLRTIEWTLALYGDRLEASRAGQAAMLERTL